LIKYLSDPSQYTTDWVTSTAKYLEGEGLGFDGKFEASPDTETYRGSKERYEQFNDDKITIEDNEFKASYAKFTDLQKRYNELIDNVTPNTDTGNTNDNIHSNELKNGEGEVTT